MNSNPNDQESKRLRGLEQLQLWHDLWERLLAAFPSAKVNEGTSAVYLELLKDLEPEQLRAAIAQVASSHQYATLPTIAQIREAAGCLGDQTAETAMDIYGATMRELSVARAEGRIPQLDPIAREVVTAMGGSWALLTSDNGPADRAQFRDTYNAKLKQRQTEASIVPAAREIVGPPERKQLPASSAIPFPRSARTPEFDLQCRVAEIREKATREIDSSAIQAGPVDVEARVRELREKAAADEANVRRAGFTTVADAAVKAVDAATAAEE